MTKNVNDPQEVIVRCAEKDGVPYVYVDRANSGIVDGNAELEFVVARGCDATIVRVEARDNCQVVKDEPGEGGKRIVHIAYQTQASPSTQVTFDLVVRLNGVEQYAYGRELNPDESPQPQSASAAPQQRNPPPEVVFP